MACHASTEVLESDHQWQESYIYRVPKKLHKVNEEAYTPKLVSIGPFHHDLEELRGVKLQKLIYLNKFCIRVGKSKKDLASIIERKKDKISRSYSETFQLNQDFVKMILLDTIFIIELFLRNFFLQKFYKSAFNGSEEVAPFLELTCQFFFSDKHRIPMDKKVKHFTDLQRLFYHPIDIKPHPKPTKHLRYTATKLYEAGLEFKAVDLDFSKRSLLDKDFAKHKCLEDYLCLNLSWLFSCLPCLKSFGCFKSVQCILKVPILVIDDQTKAFFRNLMALEQFHYPSYTYICNYVLLLDYLITTTANVCLLVEKKQRLNEHVDNLWNHLMASLASVYFRNFWRGTATVAGILVLVFSFGNFLQPFLMKI
ncbi:UPF0481 protein At3g47200-like [Alnus glutinosa]|uniref:UPF0481 protein At3g47200-like n=1 Tax=Alnus glutinosa TaxID=3517 RepID=UPI002D79EE63|nr:UPF0481 protein At3g47200-like [Alnus glutinosa]